MLYPNLENLRKWLIANKLSLNVAKTEFILIGSKPMIKSISNKQPNISIYICVILPRVCVCVCYVCVSIIMVFKNLDQLCKISLKSLLRDVK